MTRSVSNSYITLSCVWHEVLATAFYRHEVFCQEQSSAVGKGKKRKIGRNINVQPTALARRRFPSK